MARKPRVHEIAAEHGIDSKLALRALRDMAEYVKGPSSSVQPPVARKLGELLRSGWQPGDAVLPQYMRDPRLPTPEPKPDDTLTVLDRVRATVLALHLPHELPALMDLLAASATADTAGQRLLREAIASRNLFYSPGAAADSIEAEGGRTRFLGVEAVPVPLGLAVIRGRPEDAHQPDWILAWRLREASLSVVECQMRLHNDAGAPTFRLSPLVTYEVDATPAGFLTAAPALRRLAGLVGSIPTTEQSGPDGAEDQTRNPDGETVRQRDVSGTQLIYLHQRTGQPERGAGSGVRRESQWMVRGHWREQWYPSAEDHKRIWIDQHAAGNTNGPVPERRRVYVIRPRE